MRALILMGVLATGCVLQVHADEPTPSDAIYAEFVAAIPKDKKSVRKDLEYWHERQRYFERHWPVPRPPVRKSVRTADGQVAEVVLLYAPALSMPGFDVAVAFLLVEHRVVDCASCRACNRTASQNLQLEDVDGDGLLDVSFRAEADGFWGHDERIQTRPGDKRKWLFAYAITSNGFRSLFPSPTNRP